jgi:TatD DNase family protein
MIDTHCHVDFKDFNKNRAEVIDRARGKLIAIINSGATLGGNRRTLRLINEYKGFVYGSLGLHPINASKIDSSVLDQILNEISMDINNIVAIGETGLDFHRIDDYDKRKKQERVFKLFIDLANEHEMPMVIHARDAEERAFEIVKKYSMLKNVIFHCYGGDLETARSIVEEGYYISISTMICFSKHHQKLVAGLPISSILTETDSPYLSPFKGRKNEPAFLDEVIKAIAEIKSLSFSEVEKITEKTASNIFGLKK